MTAVTDRAPAEPSIPKRDRRLRWSYAIALALIVATLTWLVEFSSVMGLRSVRVSGLSRLSGRQVEQAVDTRSGTPLARLDLAAIGRRVARLGPVASVTVHRVYPNTLSIDVVERVAVGYDTTGTGVALVDGQGVPFIAAERAPRGLPRLRPALASGADAASAELAEAEVAASLSGSIRRTVSSLSAHSPESVVLWLSDGRAVMWGGADRGVDKSRLLGVLLKRPGRYFDLSDPSVVISRASVPTPLGD
jgi:cell division protein FtsQ